MDKYFLPKLDQLRHDLIFGDHNRQILKIWIFFPSGLVDAIIMTRTKGNNFKGICTTSTKQNKLIFDYLIINKVFEIYKTVQSNFPNLGKQYNIHHVKLTKSSLLQLL